MKERSGRKSFVWAVFFACGILGIGPVFADRCPECVDPHNNACKLWAGGQAKFQWATGKNVSSDITLTAGPCGQPGESGTAYIFAYMNAHRTRCDSDGDTNPCGGDMEAHDTFAIIRVSGNQRAFKHIFPGGLSLLGNEVVGTPPWWACTTVDKTGCDYQLLVGYPQGMRVTLTAAVAQCQPEFDNSKFGINITFWEIRHDDPYDYSMLARAQGSITVKANKKTDCDPINFKPDLRDGSATAWIEEIERDYSSGGDDEWMISYTAEDGNGACDYNTEGWLGPYEIDPHPGTLIPAGQTFCRVKFPAYKTDVYETPGYASMEGWSYSFANKTITLNMGNSGAVHYHCNTKSGNRYVLSSIEHCGDGVEAGNGETKWKFLYDGNDRLQYIYNGVSPGDPNNPQTGTEYYAFEWTGNDPDVDYFSRKDTQSSWGLERQWELEFDSKDRAVKYRSNCSGCGGSGEFEHIEYHDTFEDVIVRRFNAAGNPILENTVDQLTYGQYEPAYWIWITNPGFELPDVPTGYCQVATVPGWNRTSGDPGDVLICDPNSSQVLRLAGLMGDVTLEQDTVDVIWPDTKYYFEASVRSIPGAGAGTATISLCSTELGVGNPLAQVTYSGSDGYWMQKSILWDSALYSGTSPEAEFIITITGNNVEVDDVSLSALAFVGNVTKPVITEQKVYDETAQTLVTAATWQYDKDNFIVRERKYVDASNYMASKYEYQDGTFTVLKKRIDCETLNDDPDNPTGETYTTIYDPNDTLQTYTTYYPRRMSHP